MDLTRVDQTKSALQQTTVSTMRGGIAIDHKDMSGPLIATMDSNQLHASAQNADLRKKLRVDRVRKMTMGSTTSGVQIEDPQ